MLSCRSSAWFGTRDRVRLFSRVLSLLGYLTYSLVVLVAMLWLLFPAEALRSRIEAELQAIRPDLQWNIGELRPAFPAALQLSDITIREIASGNELFRVKSLFVRPDLRAYLQGGKLSSAYGIVLPSGRIEGRLTLQKKKHVLLYNGTVTGIHLAEIHGLSEKLDRSLSGVLSGDFTGTGQLHDPGSIVLEGMGRVVQGTISFKEPVLGMDQLAFTEVSSWFHYGSGEMQLLDGRLRSRLLTGTFTGTVQLKTMVLNRSELRLQGTLVPRSEFLAGLGEEVDVKLLKKQLQRGGGLPFSVNGTVQQPGIIFKGLPSGLKKRLQVRGS